MIWPSAGEYEKYLARPPRYFTHRLLRGLKVQEIDSLLGQRIYSSGGFAFVAKVKLNGRYWALRLLKSECSGYVERYQFLEQLSMRGGLPPSFRNTRVVAEGLVDPQRNLKLPVVMIEWCHGTTLERYVRQACEQGQTANINLLREKLVALEQDLYEHTIAHGDVSGKNILVDDSEGDLQLFLVDYDSVWMPEIATLVSPTGVGDLQHPQRPNPIGADADRVAFAFINLALGALERQPSLADGALLDQTFLCSQLELLTGESASAVAMRTANPERFEELVGWLRAPYESLLRPPFEDVHRQELSDQISVREGAHRLGVPVRELRKLAAQAGLELSDGVLSPADLGRIARMRT